MDKHKLLLALSILLAAGFLVAAPLRFTPVQIVQPDGQELDIYASGDEFHNWLHDADNYTIVQNDAGYYTYARSESGNVLATELIVGRDTPQQRGLQPGVNLGSDQLRAKYERYPGMRDYSDAKSPHTGQFNNIVIFIKFSDDPDFASPITVYDELFNNADGNSMKRYFTEASYNQLNIDSSFYPPPNGTTIICYTDIYPRNYFRIVSAGNPKGYNGDDDRTQREHQLLLRAVNAVAPSIPADLVIDGDNDGYVDNTCFIIKGSPDGWAELLWPHRWVLYTVNAMIHGKRVWDFNFQLESSTLGSGAGVLSHEMFHSLGSPDLYRYSDTTIDPIGSWDLMCADQNPPQHMSVWMKHHYGQWVPNVPDITESGTYTLSPVASSATNNIYRIASWRTNEYYLLEYRRPSAHYDSNIPGTGLLVYRLNTQESGNAQGPPDELYIYRPYGTNTTTNGVLSMAEFSAQNGLTELSEATSPNGFLSNNAPGGLNLYDVGIAGETISFKVKISQVQVTYPHGGETWFSGSNKTITWKAKTSTGTVSVDYSTDGGSTWINLGSAAPNNGSFFWNNIPVLNSSLVHVRVTHNTSGQMDFNTYPFTIISEMAIPAGTYPANGAASIPTNPLLAWTAVPGVTGYQVQVSANPEYSSYLVNLLDHPENTYQLSGLTPFATYYWRVCSISEIGIGPFCETMSFTTGNLTELPAAPALVSPAQMAVNLPRTVLFQWSNVPLASSYNLQLSLTQWFVDLVADIQDIPFNFHEIQNLLYNTVYYWRVCSSNVAGSSNFSQIRHFRTMAGTDADDVTSPVVDNSLAQNHPNPFNPNTTISLSLKNPSANVQVQVFDIKGRLVRTLFEGAGGKNHLDLVWDGKDKNGDCVGSGIYYYRMQSEDFVQTRKMLLMK